MRNIFQTLALLRRTGADALSVDLLRHDRRDDDELGELLDSGRRLVAGVVPGTGLAGTSPASEVGDTVGVVTALGKQGIWIRDLADPACLRACTHITTEAGVYRVEVYRRYLGKRRGWIYSNPIYVRSTLLTITSPHSNICSAFTPPR